MNDTAGSAGLTPAPSAAPDAAAAPATRKARLRPLRLLVPYVLRYRVRAAAALVALLAAALTTLAVPIAVRRMIDFGFEGERVGLIDQYFGVMIAVVAVLAVASASPVRAIDISDPTNPVTTAYLSTTSMLDPWESLKVNPARKLLGADKGSGINFTTFRSIKGPRLGGGTSSRVEWTMGAAERCWLRKLRTQRTPGRLRGYCRGCAPLVTELTWCSILSSTSIRSCC
jgi:hypothetical protein